MPISAKESINKLKEEVKNCRKCLDLVKTRKQSVSGTGSPKANIMIVGNYPRAEGAEKRGIPFTGDDSGKLVRKIFDETKLSLIKNIYITYLVKCTPRKTIKKGSNPSVDNIEPLKKHINNCISYLTAEISIITPHIIVSMGLNVSNIILQKFFSVEKKYRSMKKIHMRVFENPSFKLVPFFSPQDVILNNIINEERYTRDFKSLSKFLKIV